MKLLVIFGSIFLLFIFVSSLYGEIYSWTDTNGIMHFTNYDPPPHAKIFIKDVKSQRHEVKDDQNVKETSEQPALERHEIQEDVEAKFDETIRGIEDLERDLEDAEVMNQGLKRKLIVANQKADAALAYAEDLEYNLREVTSVDSSGTYYVNAFYHFPVVYWYGYPYNVHRLRFEHNRFYARRASIGRYPHQSPKRSHHGSFIGRTHNGKPHRAVTRRNSQLGSRHVGKSYRISVRSNARFGHR